MYRYFKGQVTDVCATHITFEVNNIGYRIKVPNPYQFELNKDIIIHLHYHVKEDSNELFGFLTKDERDIFESLISVNGLGPKGALAILASSSPSEIVCALNDSNSSFFKQFPGIGPKLSQQIILDLQGKLDLEVNKTNVLETEKLNNVITALKSLGYSNAEIKTVTKSLDLSQDISLSEAVKTALRMLKKN